MADGQSSPKQGCIRLWTTNCANPTHRSSLFPSTQKGMQLPVLQPFTQPTGCCEGKWVPGKKSLVNSGATSLCTGIGREPVKTSAVIQESPDVGLRVTTGKTSFTLDSEVSPFMKWGKWKGPATVGILGSSLCPLPAYLPGVAAVLWPSQHQAPPNIWSVATHSKRWPLTKTGKNELFFPTKKPVLLQ